MLRVTGESRLLWKTLLCIFHTGPFYVLSSPRSDSLCGWLLLHCDVRNPTWHGQTCSLNICLWFSVRLQLQVSLWHKHRRCSCSKESVLNVPHTKRLLYFQCWALSWTLREKIPLSLIAVMMYHHPWQASQRSYNLIFTSWGFSSSSITWRRVCRSVQRRVVTESSNLSWQLGRLGTSQKKHLGSVTSATCTCHRQVPLLYKGIT